MNLTRFDRRTGQRFTTNLPAHRQTLLALGTVLLAQVMAPTAAQAQCNSSSNPPPPPPVTANFFNQSFGNTPLQPYNVSSFGLVGCNGADGNDPGSPGSPGQPGARISSANSGL